MCKTCVSKCKEQLRVTVHHPAPKNTYKILIHIARHAIGTGRPYYNCTYICIHLTGGLYSLVSHELVAGLPDVKVSVRARPLVRRGRGRGRGGRCRRRGRCRGGAGGLGGVDKLAVGVLHEAKLLEGLAHPYDLPVQPSHLLKLSCVAVQAR